MIKSMILQLIRFGIVGMLAAIVHFIAVVSFVESGFLPPLTANGVAFLVAFPVSYSGHRYWTFAQTTANHQIAIPKLFLVAFSNWIANQGLFFIFLKVFTLPYMIALILVLMLLPLMTFILGKYWIFR